jgi:hypothetical protein
MWQAKAMHWVAKVVFTFNNTAQAKCGLEATQQSVLRAMWL